MPNIKSAKKRVLISKANNERNKSYRSALKTAVKHANAATDNKEEAVKVAIRKIDKAAAKGIIRTTPQERKALCREA